MISHHAALIYTMVMVSAADREMTDAELRKIGEIVRGLPVFADYDPEDLAHTAAECADILDEPEGLEKTLALIAQALPEKLRETAYALACEIAAADSQVPEEEQRMLQLIRHRLQIPRLIAAAIERSARARFSKL